MQLLSKQVITYNQPWSDHPQIIVRVKARFDNLGKESVGVGWARVRRIGPRQWRVENGAKAANDWHFAECDRKSRAMAKAVELGEINASFAIKYPDFSESGNGYVPQAGDESLPRPDARLA